MATQNIYALTDTWNAGGTTFTGIGLNVTDTASAAGSALIDLQVGGASQFKVSKAGAATITTIELGNASDTTLSRVSAGVVAIEGVEVTTNTATQTLSNKTLSSPTLSGTSTFTGSAFGITTLGVNTSSVTSPFTVDIVATADNGDRGVRVQNASTGAGATTQVRFANSGSTTHWIGAASTTFSVYAGIRADNLSLYTNGANGIGLTADNAAGFITFNAGSAGPEVMRVGPAAVTIADAANLILATGTGTKIGTATSQKLGFFNQTPVVQPTAVADATTAVDVITRFNELLTRMRNLGLIAT